MYCNGDTNDFGDLTLHRATEADFDDIVQFLMSDFLFTEPLNRSINLTQSDAINLFRELTKTGITSSLSYLLRTRTGKIIALRLASILDRPEKDNPDANEVVNNNNNNVNNNNVTNNIHSQNANAAKITRILSELEDKIWILVNPRIKRLLCWVVISVDSHFTRRGLARKLLEYRLDEAELMGCQGCITEASAFNSQQLFRKLGYELLHEIKHCEWLDENGKQIFRCDDATNSIELVYRPF
ncbi:unnamed protein product [Anisakis simplex]|uniref:aralkylamine N-acetyltransferase n=1 Tax=Anisakis simplex TaxID=6269 RepID=A0A0M3K9M7_ANISI|nr:unnamed protein product [Anisakis simplex]